MQKKRLKNRVLGLYNAEAYKKIGKIVKDKKVLFISSKNRDYIRNVQEIDFLKSVSECTVCSGKGNSYIFRMIKVMLWLLFHPCRHYDVVFIGFAPQLILPVFSCKFKKSIVIIDFFISVYDTMVHDRKRIKSESLLAHLLENLDKTTLKHADHVIADTKAHGEYFCDAFGLDRARLTVLYLEADREIYYPTQKPGNNKFTVLYFGSILPLQGVSIIIDAIDKLKSLEYIKFVLIGPLNKRDKERLKVCGNATLYNWLTQHELADEIASSDLCLAGHFDNEIDKAKRTIPGKAYIYRAMEKPMILGDCAANREIFIEDNETVFVPQGDAEALVDAIIKYHNKRQTRQ